MDVVCSAFAMSTATSYCGVACMTSGGGVYCDVNSIAGFNDMYVHFTAQHAFLEDIQSL